MDYSNGMVSPPRAPDVYQGKFSWGGVYKHTQVNRCNCSCTPTELYTYPAQLSAYPAPPYGYSASPYVYPAQPHAHLAQPYAQPAQPYAHSAQTYAYPVQPVPHKHPQSYACCPPLLQSSYPQQQPPVPQGYLPVHLTYLPQPLSLAPPSLPPPFACSTHIPNSGYHPPQAAQPAPSQPAVSSPSGHSTINKRQRRSSHSSPERALTVFTLSDDNEEEFLENPGPVRKSGVRKTLARHPSHEVQHQIPILLPWPRHPRSQSLRGLTGSPSVEPHDVRFRSCEQPAQPKP
ncbi:hypothetical protein K458DRAFT_463642 [Lentithecium fluviatile CBS 122367]|uniref:Uncharacterized protein n=1 Tax=Lentithecium fluviatile CBS 122367 TaxID=1168545 RepID=A0A6G1IJN5_9PLEO|nr:hypothetical protein K458DRAFT_463642 [Lentithecium fluviatile CBS 122367]